ncbi:MAG: FKBP-type peptidyl-prolyl cis-trans isomerase [Gammaproteobacteria bacterium]|nr:FKBP-type peptidyl-prolyl cis-trans isomerase [Gammaproteobacteria bacterium]MDH4312582.1 FKBP-type peptidyl-prolyl cis-trans isomerase [Gammaproteobacteria bacterium]MDH5272260.1 FKBP-type peptidyl-prolyl cis-trans isomerase [Gammaproteobacteria bacterium]
MRRISFAPALSAAVVVLACAALAGCARTPVPAVAPVDQVAALEVTDLVIGQGATATPGSNVTVHYAGWIYDDARPERKGAEFDSSRKSGQPFSFVLGQRQVIAGWDQGVNGMKVGGQRRLVIPSALAYGDRGAGGVIAPGATLVFDVELLGVESQR